MVMNQLNPGEPVELTFEELVVAARAFAMRSLAAAKVRSPKAGQTPASEGIQEEVVAVVLDHCRGYGWVNDDRYGAMAVRAGAAKGHGPLRIRF